MNRCFALRSALIVAAVVVLTGSLSATEFGASHLVFEKTTKMKKVAVSVLMSFLDQSVKGDTPGDRRQLRCGATTIGKGGTVPAKGRFIVRLLGDDGGAPWQSAVLARSLDERGEAVFDADAILGLVDGAGGAEAELFRIDFDGGKGSKVAQVSVDCIHEREDG